MNKETKMAEHPDKQKWIDLATKQLKGRAPGEH
jgi:hypothetical protein